MSQDKGTALGWEDEAQVQDSQYDVLPEGEYTYEVVNFKRERFNGSDKMSPCPVAALLPTREAQRVTWLFASIVSVSLAAASSQNAAFCRMNRSASLSFLRWKRLLAGRGIKI